jgi:hypothetical protein
MIDWMESDKPYLVKHYFVDKSIQEAAFAFESIDTGRHRRSPIKWTIGPLGLLRIEPSKTRVQCSHAQTAEIPVTVRAQPFELSCKQFSR